MAENRDIVARMLAAKALQNSGGEIPLLTTAERLALQPTNAMITYDTTIKEFFAYDGAIWAILELSSEWRDF